MVASRHDDPTSGKLSQTRADIPINTEDTPKHLNAKGLAKKFEHLYKFSELDALKKKFNITPETTAWTCLTPTSSGTATMVSRVVLLL